MLTWLEEHVACPCGASIVAKVADAIHVSRASEVRQQVLDRTFHRATCAHCGRRIALERKLLYTDFRRHHWIGVCPLGWMPRWPAIERALTAEFDHMVCRAAPPIVQALGPQFRVRLVFGYDQLAEKLYIFDAGLDDRIIERVKLRIVAKHPELAVPGAQVLLRPPAADAARFELEVFRSGVDGHSVVGFDRELYDREAAHGGPHELDDGAFVGIDRILAPSTVAAPSIAWPELAP